MGNRDIGRAGEDIAELYLTRLGYTILGRNIRLGRGEIDILAKAGSTLIVVEVKTRLTSAFGRPEDQVTRGKLARLCRLAAAAGLRHQAQFTRIDFVGVTARGAVGSRLVDVTVTHIPDISS
ncbi:MAG: YraN family protein [Firmicutes bacterium]|jgi:putative endonuclease|nr:YraN family protein [Bacillota bacterium]